LPEELLQKYRIRVVPILVVFGDEALRDRVDITLKEFYVRLRSGDPLPTTSAPSPAQYQEAFEAAKAAGAEGVVAVCLSSKLSMAYASAYAAAQAMDEFPVAVIDSRLATTAQGFVALAAARAASQDTDLDGVVARAQRSIAATGFVAVLDTLSYLHRGGRVPAIASLVASALHLHPVMGNRRDGTVGIIAVARSKRAATAHMLRAIESRSAERGLRSLAVMHADASEEAVQLGETVVARFECDELYTVEFSPVMAAHSGPGLIGLAYQTRC
jgi:DegV family protein with EDD domain